jgi:hypothetical protein
MAIGSETLKAIVECELARVADKVLRRRGLAHLASIQNRSFRGSNAHNTRIWLGRYLEAGDSASRAGRGLFL